MHRFSQQEMTERASLYALGALSQWEAREFEEHLAEGCETCAAELRSFEEAARAIALSAPETEPPARVRDRLMSLVAEEARTESKASRKADAPPLITLRAHEGEWVKVGGGIKIKHLFTDPQTGMVTTLVKMKPGAQIPLHRHSGIEQCYVIEGDFHAANQELGAGDFHVAPAGSTHEPVYTKGGALVLIVAPPGYEPLAQHQ
jgi:anti-sigma factor ChrR (cupin superfamily)